MSPTSRTPIWCAPSTRESATPSSCPTSPDGPRSCSTRSRCARSRFADEAQLEHRSPGIGAVPRGDAPAEPQHGRVTEREAEPAALPGCRGAEEGLEQPGQDGGGDAAAVILHLVHHAGGEPSDAGQLLTACQVLAGFAQLLVGGLERLDLGARAAALFPQTLGEPVHRGSYPAHRVSALGQQTRSLLLRPDGFQRAVDPLQPAADAAFEQPDRDEDEERDEQPQRREQAAGEHPELLAHRPQILPELDRPSGNVFAEYEQLANPLAAGRARAIELPHSGSVGAVSAGASLQNVGETRARIRDRAAIDPVAAP